MIKTETLDVGIVVERRAVDHPWLDHEWVCVGVVPGAPAAEDWTELDRGEGWIRYHACFRTLKLHRRETADYVANLESRQPAVYVVFRGNDDSHDEAPLLVALATVSVFEAEDHMGNGEDTVHRVAMPEPVAAWMRNFIAQHHHAQPFVKRQRDKHAAEEHRFGQEPIVELRKRRDYTHEDSSDG
jgi:hypothetical protein